MNCLIRRESVVKVKAFPGPFVYNMEEKTCCWGMSFRFWVTLRSILQMGCRTNHSLAKVLARRKICLLSVLHSNRPSVCCPPSHFELIAVPKWRKIKDSDIQVLYKRSFMPLCQTSCPLRTVHSLLCFSTLCWRQGSEKMSDLSVMLHLWLRLNVAQL